MLVSTRSCESQYDDATKRRVRALVTKRLSTRHDRPINIAQQNIRLETICDRWKPTSMIDRLTRKFTITFRQIIVYQDHHISPAMDTGRTNFRGQRMTNRPLPHEALDIGQPRVKKVLRTDGNKLGSYIKHPNCESLAPAPPTILNNTRIGRLRR